MAEIEIALNPVEGRKLGNWRNEQNEQVKYNVYSVILSNFRIARM